MLDFPRWKKIMLWGLTLFGVLAALPSIFSVANQRWPDALPDPTVNLGLDLAGGSHILLEAEPSQVERQRIENMEESVRSALRSADPRINHGEVSTSNGRLTFTLDDTSQIDAAREVILPLTSGAGLTGQRDWTIEVMDGNRFEITPTRAGLDQAITTAMDSATEVVRKRIDSLGTREPTIIRQGDTRIVVQVPGLDDPQALKELLGKTAKLEFKLVDQSALPSDVEQGIAPIGSEIFPVTNPDAAGGAPAMAVVRLGGIKGDNLTNAQASRDPNTNEPVVDITFDQQGGARFCQLTQENVNKPFAIILDEAVISAPNITEAICGGRAQISGGFTVPESQTLAISLQSGALPVDLTVIEERTVGPDLGADSIRKGMIALAAGAVVVLLLMAAVYGRFGIYANIALVLNVLIILGIMALINTTLTLPGIAGFVLTIGSAVDANVLINERIREERRRGRRVFQAVENGYKEAARAIYDANITNVIAAALLFYFGSGPIRGFAIVLVIGIITSVFTAVFLTRMWVSGWLRKARPADLNV